MTALFVGLAVLAFFASVGLAGRLGPRSRAELITTSLVLVTAIACFPIHVLGWANALYPWTVAAFALGLIAVFGTAALAFDGRQRMVAVRRDALLVMRAPFDALRITARERSLAFVGWATVLAVFCWTLLLAYLAPSSGWDGVWYHDTIVGFALQNHGYRPVRVPLTLELVNGYPKISESLGIWSTLFWDRRLIDATPSWASLILVSAFVATARRHGVWASGRIGMASVLFLVPAAVLQLRSTYVDVIVLALSLAATFYTTSPSLRPSDIALAWLTIGLASGTKPNAFAYGALLACTLTVRVAIALFRKRTPTTQTWLAFGFGAVLAMVLVLPTPVRNWQMHRNPLWPVHVESALFGIDWPGLDNIDAFDRPTKEWVADVFAPPKPNLQFHDTRDNGYGNGIPFVVFPLVPIALAFALRTSARRVDDDERKASRNALLVFTLGSASLAASPTLWWARFNLVAVAAAVLLVSWWLGRQRRTLAEGVVGALIVTAGMTLHWSDPAWDVPPSDVPRLVTQSAAERATYKHSFCTLPTPTALVRDAELRAGDVVAFNDDLGFPAVLWNETFSNRLVYVPFRTHGYLRSLDAADAEWAVVRRGSPPERVLRTARDRWGEVGPTTDINVAYRRLVGPQSSP